MTLIPCCTLDETCYGLLEMLSDEHERITTAGDEGIHEHHIEVVENALHRLTGTSGIVVYDYDIECYKYGKYEES